MKPNKIKNMNSICALIISIAVFIIWSCEQSDDPKPPTSFNLFSVNDDIKLGEDFHTELSSNPSEYPILSESQYPNAYAYLKELRDRLLTSNNLKYADRFDWNVYIIDKPVLNAFCTPGGNMYFYTGLIEYLDDEAQFAGVVGHEMAHADHRHVTDRMTTLYGLEVLWQIISGQNSSKLADIAKDMALGLGALQFSRSNEYDADEFAMYYTEDAGIDPSGIKDFFEKLDEQAQSRPPEFLSTHPNPENRIGKINENFADMSNPPTARNKASYDTFKASLP